jgi:hypothetical protein
LQSIWIKHGANDRIVPSYWWHEFFKLISESNLLHKPVFNPFTVDLHFLLVRLFW